MATFPLSFISPVKLPPANSLLFRSHALNIPLHSRHACLPDCQFRFPVRTRSQSHRISSQLDDRHSDFEGAVQDLRIPEYWLSPSKALEESNWLRVALHKWLDDEYCPEATNVEISKVAADSYYRSLLQKSTDLGEILLQMARELESISYQESFHGAFSSANAAIDLISQRIEHD
ncbi:hypothetical protein Nepgr_022319 [Nepenthes gracilis]|uniref:Uncharacterized protein n=1 Tax=Nepenthes gracilis TaxID=150966 RepID=A0AAD3SYH7_NEPGR|nr:hypothetical protein Nepgr_022319 [Nepenthes gracilis]